MKHTPQKTRKHLAGFTLIEVLVTLIILAVGLLGMAAMQLTGIRSTNGSSYRTQASILANDIAERMRANTTAVNNDNAFMAVNGAALNCNAAPAPYCGEYFDGSGVVAAQACTPAQMAAYDINVWFCGELNAGGRQGGVRDSLPQATASIACIDTDPPAGDADVCSDDSPHLITVGWTEPNPQRNGPDTITQSISITMKP